MKGAGTKGSYKGKKGGGKPWQKGWMARRDWNQTYPGPRPTQWNGYYDAVFPGGKGGKGGDAPQSAPNGGVKSLLEQFFENYMMMNVLKEVPGAFSPMKAYGQGKGPPIHGGQEHVNITGVKGDAV